MSKFWSRNTKSAKLTQGEVIEIRTRYRQGGITQGQLAIEYSISVVQIGRILRRESWQDAPELRAQQEEIAASAARMLAVQESVTSRMSAAIKEQREKETRGDTLLGELTGEPNDNRK